MPIITLALMKGTQLKNLHFELCEYNVIGFENCVFYNSPCVK